MTIVPAEARVVIVLQTQEFIGIPYKGHTAMHKDSLYGVIFRSMLVQELLGTEDIGAGMDSPVDAHILHSLVFTLGNDHGNTADWCIDDFFLFRYHIIKYI